MSDIIDFLLDRTQSHNIEASPGEGTVVTFVYAGISMSIRLRRYDIPLDEFKPIFINVCLRTLKDQVKRLLDQSALSQKEALRLTEEVIKLKIEEV